MAFNGDNRRSEFKYNDFYKTFPASGVYADVSIRQLLYISQGRVNVYQGSPSDPARNCFSRAQSGIFALPTETQKFYYWVHENAENTPVCILEPSNNISTGGYHNYEIKDSQFEIPEACGEIIPENPKKEGLIDARSDLYAAEQVWQQNPHDSVLYENYWLAYVAKDGVLRSLLRNYRDAGEYQDLELALQEENNEQANRWLLSHYFDRQNWSKAQQLINTLPVTTQDDQWYKAIMQINANRLPNPVNYQLNSQEQTLLTAIASSQSPIRSYARSILTFHTGVRFGTEDPEMPEIPLQGLPPATTPIQDLFQRVYPNPAGDILHLNLRPEEMDLTINVRIFSSDGRLQHVESLRELAHHHVDMSFLPAGVYWIQILSENKSVESYKIVKQ
jgi:hypothetical protein